MIYQKHALQRSCDQSGYLPSIDIANADANRRVPSHSLLLAVGIVRKCRGMLAERRASGYRRSCPRCAQVDQSDRLSHAHRLTPPVAAAEPATCLLRLLFASFLPAFLLRPPRRRPATPGSTSQSGTATGPRSSNRAAPCGYSRVAGTTGPNDSQPWSARVVLYRRGRQSCSRLTIVCPVHSVCRIGPPNLRTPLSEPPRRTASFATGRSRKHLGVEGCYGSFASRAARPLSGHSRHQDEFTRRKVPGAEQGVNGSSEVMCFSRVF